MYICKSLAIISDIVCVCVCVRIRSATAATTIGRTQCAHKLAFINNPKRLVSENDREREREREITVSTHAIDSYIYYYVFMYKRRIRCQITPSTFYYYVTLRGIYPHRIELNSYHFIYSCGIFFAMIIDKYIPVSAYFFFFSQKKIQFKLTRIEKEKVPKLSLFNIILLRLVIWTTSAILSIESVFGLSETTVPVEYRSIDRICNPIDIIIHWSIQEIRCTHSANIIIGVSLVNLSL